jgi:5S rRNA maturation endonuclease (ribonuclease M5)
MDAVSRSQRLAFVVQQLSIYSGEKRSLGNGSTMVLCPYHSEKTPSGRIFHSESTYSPGYYKCYGCTARAKWDDVAPKLGLEPFYSGPPKEEFSMDLFMKKAEKALTQTERYRKDKFKFWNIPANRKWRGISTNLLIELGGRMCYKWNEEWEKWGATKHIYMPVIINGEQHGFFRARLKKDPEGVAPSYLLAAADGSGWSLSHGLWPFDHCVDMMVDLKSRTVVLVEGQRDALRLITLGIPAMCIFGTQSWTDNKAKLLEIAGVDRVILMMDGDDAGIDATARLYPLLKQMFKVSVIKLWAIKGSPYIQFKNEDEPSKAAKAAGVTLWDPGNLPVSIINRIEKKYF